MSTLDAVLMSGLLVAAALLLPVVILGKVYKIAFERCELAHPRYAAAKRELLIAAADLTGENRKYNRWGLTLRFRRVIHHSFFGGMTLLDIDVEGARYKVPQYRMWIWKDGHNHSISVEEVERLASKLKARLVIEGPPPARQ